MFEKLLAWVISSVKDFPSLLAATLGYFFVYWGMLFSPRQQFRSIATKKSGQMMTAGIFLPVNLMVAAIVSKLPIPTSLEISKALNSAVSKFPEYIAGTILFLLLMYICVYGVRFDRKKLLSLFCVFSYSSVVYLPYIVTVRMLSRVLGGLFLDFWSLGMSGSISSIRKLIQPFVAVSPFAIPLLLMLATILFWWAWLMYTGLNVFHPAPSKVRRMLKIGFTIGSYMTVKVLVLYAMLGMALFSLVRSAMEYEEMLTAITQEPASYPRALALSEKIAGSRFIPPVAHYRALIIGSLAQIKTYAPEKDELQKPLALIRRREYREAELLLKKYVAGKMVSRKDPMRSIYYNVANKLKKAEVFYNSPEYSEAPNQTSWVFVPTESVPFSIFPD